ncbi:hypothetical protein D3C71_1408640 [compost metagenome]
MPHEARRSPWARQIAGTSRTPHRHPVHPAESTTTGSANPWRHRPGPVARAGDQSAVAGRGFHRGCQGIAAARRTPGAASSYPQCRRSDRSRNLQRGSAPRKWFAGGSFRRQRTGCFWTWRPAWPGPWLPPRRWLHRAARHWPAPGRSGRWSVAGSSAALRAALGRSLADRGCTRCTSRDFPAHYAE